MNCYLSRNYKGLGSAGNKAKTDIEKIMADMGFKNVGLPQTTYNSKVKHFLFTLMGVLKSPFGLHKGDILVLQYPLKKYFSAVCNMAHMRGAYVVVVIHDLGSFRRKALTEAKEISRLNHADYIIAHNDVMKMWLKAHGCTAEVATLGIFDYLSDTVAPVRNAPSKPLCVTYAGALSLRKNKFLYEWGKYISGFKVRLYGNGFDADAAQNGEVFEKMGFIESDELIATAKGDFGLVWDGSSPDSCTGNWGEYLRFNNPHKTSLYIRCHLPVVIWSEAALAPFVRDNGIGLCISSLAELGERLAAVTPDDYARMQENIIRVSRLLSEGHYFKAAVTEAVDFFCPDTPI